MSQRFAAPVVLIAGGAGALGRAVRVAFPEEGALASVTYRQRNQFDALRQAAGPDLWRLEGCCGCLKARSAGRGGWTRSMRPEVTRLTGALWELGASVLPQMLSPTLTAG